MFIILIYKINFLFLKLTNKNIKMSHNILNVFTYETSETSDKAKYFKDCTFKVPVGDYKEGDKVPSICIQLGLYIWDENGEFVSNDEVIIK